MQKLFLAIVVGCLSLNCFANDVSSTSNSFKNALETTLQSDSHQLNTFIYGGQDVASPVIAVANENVWQGNNGYVG